MRCKLIERDYGWKYWNLGGAVHGALIDTPATAGTVSATKIEDSMSFVKFHQPELGRK